MNLNALPVKGETVVDSDGDGLFGRRGGIAGTSPLLVDTDGDDSLTCWKFVRATPGSIVCSRAMRTAAWPLNRLDDDGDGLLNCEERYFWATNSRLIDSDADGFPDDLEVRMGTNPAAMTSSTTRISMGHATQPSCKPTPIPCTRRGQFLGHCLPLQHKPAARPERPARASVLRLHGQQH